jgi:hypothetical protein
VEGQLCADDDEMVEVLGRLVHDDGLRGRLSAHNRSVEHTMTWSRSLRAHDHVYAIAVGDRLEAVVQ